MTPQEWQAAGLSLLIAAAALVASLPVAIGVAWLLAKHRFPGRILLETAVNLPLVLPPVVTGYLLLVVLGRRGVLGAWLEQSLGIRFVFDWKGAALAAAVVGFPLLVRPIRQGFAAVDDRLIQAARTLGATRWDAFCTIAVPLALPGMLCGSLLALARSMGEFGATLMFAGNIAGETRTIPLMVYTQLDAPGGIDNCYRLVIVSILLSAAALLAGDLLERYGARRFTSPGQRP